MHTLPKIIWLLTVEILDYGTISVLNGEHSTQKKNWESGRETLYGNYTMFSGDTRYLLKWSESLGKTHNKWWERFGARLWKTLNVFIFSLNWSKHGICLFVCFSRTRKIEFYKRWSASFHCISNCRHKCFMNWDLLAFSSIYAKIWSLSITLIFTR